MTEQRPNLFEMGSKELTHDAVYAWMISWANGKLADCENAEDQNLHELGLAFLSLLSKFSIEDLRGREIHVTRQWEKLDILVEVKDLVILAIENKTFSNLASHQLKEYSLKAISKAENKEIKDVVFCHVKTGSEQQHVLDTIKNYKPQHDGKVEYTTNTIANADIIKTLERFRHSLNNDTFQMFLEYLVNLEKRINTQNLEAITKDYRAFQGVMHNLQARVLNRGFERARVDYKPYNQYCGIYYGGRQVDGGIIRTEAWNKNQRTEAFIILEPNGSIKPETVIKELKEAYEQHGLVPQQSKRGKKYYVVAAGAFRADNSGNLEFDHLNEVMQKLELVVKEYSIIKPSLI